MNKQVTAALYLEWSNDSDDLHKDSLRVFYLRVRIDFSKKKKKKKSIFAWLMRAGSHDRNARIGAKREAMYLNRSRLVYPVRLSSLPMCVLRKLFSWALLCIATFSHFYRAFSKKKEKARTDGHVGVVVVVVLTIAEGNFHPTSGEVSGWDSRRPVCVYPNSLEFPMKGRKARAMPVRWTVSASFALFVHLISLSRLQDYIRRIEHHHRERNTESFSY